MTTFLFALAISVLSAFSADTWDGTTITAFSTANGAGSSEDNPILIHTGAQLAYLAQETNKGITGGGSDYVNTYFRLTADINLASNEWTPIGWHSTNANNRHFKGNFDGYGHKIINLSITTAKNGTTSGLFGAINSGYVKNLAIASGSINWGGSVGGVVGSNFSGTISQCSNAASVRGTAYIGGISGYNVRAAGSTVTPIITNCYNSGSVNINNGTATTNRAIGGVVGYATAFVSNVYNYGTVTVEGSDIAALKGALVGVVGSGGAVTNSYYKNGVVATGANSYGVVMGETDMQNTTFVTTLNDTQNPIVWYGDNETSPINNGYPIFSYKPIIEPISTLSTFAYEVGDGPSLEQIITVSGDYFSNNVVITAPTNYEVSLSSGIGFGTSVTLPHNYGELSNTVVYIRLKSGLAVGNYNENLTLSSTDAIPVDLPLVGVVNTATNVFDKLLNNKIKLQKNIIEIVEFEGNVHIYNSKGQLILFENEITSNTKFTINTPGVYIIRLTNVESNYAHKILIN